ncbi:MAG TPA: hypothetical protein VGY57_15410 [Vicinamibacterales bacterium]|jgi:Flp pilus assembly pilin Flp|nr:hypothetical protein [Vicinamibacterales bacterium]
MSRALRAMLCDESGAVLTEYGIVLALLAGGAMTLLIAIAASANSGYTQIATNMQSFQSNGPAW